MKITYDPSADAAYIYLQENGASTLLVDYTHTCDTNDMINIDFDSHGKIIGIECIPATKLLRKEVLEQAELL